MSKTRSDTSPAAKCQASLDTVLSQRHSVRAFLDKAVPSEQLQQIFALAQQSPSNCNVQPWQTYVLSGEQKDQLKQALIAEVMKQQPPNPDFDWKIAYQGIHRERQFGAANALYSAMDIERSDKMQRNIAMLRNWAFFDAPHVAIFTMDKYLGMMGAVDMGIYAQTLSLLLKERGIDSCMQGALGQYPDPIRQQLNLADDCGVLFGMSFGYADTRADANRARTQREPLENSVVFL